MADQDPRADDAKTEELEKKPAPEQKRADDDKTEDPAEPRFVDWPGPGR